MHVFTGGKRAVIVELGLGADFSAVVWGGDAIFALVTSCLGRRAHVVRWSSRHVRDAGWMIGPSHPEPEAFGTGLNLIVEERVGVGDGVGELAGELEVDVAEQL